MSWRSIRSLWSTCLTPSCATAKPFSLNVSSVKQLQLDHHEEVKLLRLADNRLVVLGPDEFYPAVPHLQQLYLARNFITDVDEHAFRNLRTLQVSAPLLTYFIARAIML